MGPLTRSMVHDSIFSHLDCSVETITDTLDPIQKTFTCADLYRPYWRFVLFHRYVGKYKPETLNSTWSEFDSLHAPITDTEVDYTTLPSGLYQSTLELRKGGTKLLKVHVYFTTGTILLQGKACADWVNSEFDRLRSVVHTLAVSRVAPTRLAISDLQCPDSATASSILSPALLTASQDDSALLSRKCKHYDSALISALPGDLILASPSALQAQRAAQPADADTSSPTAVSSTLNSTNPDSNTVASTAAVTTTISSTNIIASNTSYTSVHISTNITTDNSASNLTANCVDNVIDVVNNSCVDTVVEVVDSCADTVVDDGFCISPTQPTTVSTSSDCVNVMATSGDDPAHSVNGCDTSDGTATDGYQCHADCVSMTVHTAVIDDLQSQITALRASLLEMRQHYTTELDHLQTVVRHLQDTTNKSTKPKHVSTKPVPQKSAPTYQPHNLPSKPVPSAPVLQTSQPAEPQNIPPPPTSSLPSKPVPSAPVLQTSQPAEPQNIPPPPTSSSQKLDTPILKTLQPAKPHNVPFQPTSSSLKRAIPIPSIDGDWPELPPLPEDTQTILLGDSVFRGLHEGKMSVDMEKARVLSISGLNKAKLIALLNGTAPLHQIRTVVVHVGVNDCKLGHVLGKGAWRAVIHAARRCFPKATLLMSSILPDRDDHYTHVTPSNGNLSEMCQTLQIGFVNNDRAFRKPNGSPQRSLFKDQLHPNVRGTSAIAVSIKRQYSSPILTLDTRPPRRDRSQSRISRSPAFPKPTLHFPPSPLSSPYHPAPSSRLPPPSISSPYHPTPSAHSPPLSSSPAHFPPLPARSQPTNKWPSAAARPHMPMPADPRPAMPAYFPTKPIPSMTAKNQTAFPHVNTPKYLPPYPHHLPPISAHHDYHKPQTSHGLFNEEERSLLFSLLTRLMT